MATVKTAAKTGGAAQEIVTPDISAPQIEEIKIETPVIEEVKIETPQEKEGEKRVPGLFMS